MADDLMHKAKAFFDNKKGLKGDIDPELQAQLKRLTREVSLARGDKTTKQALVKTLAIIERDTKARSDHLRLHITNQAAATKTPMTKQQIDAAVIKGIPRELHYMQASGLALVAALNSNSTMTEKELKKFGSRMEKFTDMVDDFKTEGAKGSSTAQEKFGGISLTERLRNQKEGQILDGKRHDQLLEKLDETSAKSKHDEEKSSNRLRLGLTALLGPAAPLFQLWFDAKDDIGKLVDTDKLSLKTMREKFKWQKDESSKTEKNEKDQTSLLGRMLKAFKKQGDGKSGKGLLGSLFGGDDDDDGGGGGGGKGPKWWRKMKIAGKRLLRGASRRVSGRTGGWLGKAAKAGGRGGIGKLARRVPILGTALAALEAGHILAGDGSARDKTVGVAGVGGALAGGAAGFEGGALLGGAIGSVVPVVGTAIGAGVGGVVGGIGGAFAGEEGVKRATAYVWDNAGKAMTAFRRVAGFFDDVGSKVGSVLYDSVEKIGNWGDEAKDKLAAFWDTLKTGASTAASVVIQTVSNGAHAAAHAADQATHGAVRKAVDFFKGESGGLSQGRWNAKEQASISSARSQGDKFRGGSGLTADQKQMITAEAVKAGVDPKFLLGEAQMESGGNPNAVSPTGAAGLFQQTGDNATQYGVTNRFNPQQSAAGAAKFASQNAAFLKAHGIDPTPENLYLAHQQGPEGARQIIDNANGKGDISAKVQAAMGKNYGNMSGAAYMALNSQKFGAASAASDATFGGTYANAVGANGTSAMALAPAGAANGAACSAPPGGYERVPAVNPTTVVQAAPPAATAGAAQTSSTNKVGMSISDFFMDDVGLLIMNRGYGD